MKKILLKIFLMMGISMALVLTITRTALYIFERYHINKPVLSYHVSLLAGFLGLLLFAVLLYFLLGKRLKKISEGVKQVSSGNYDTKITVEGKDELSDLAANFNLMTEGLRSNEYLNREFVRNVSHEFKTPVSAIMGYADLLQNEMLSQEEKTSFLNIIREEAQRLHRMSLSMLMISKLDSQANIICNDRFRVDEQIRTILLSLQKDWESKNLRIEAELERCFILSDKDLCHSVWVNLISNAVKYTNDGGLICLKLYKKNKNILFEITNTDNSLLGKESSVFMPFYTIDRKDMPKGTGLGLPLVKKITEKLGGAIQLTVNDITHFVVTLPATEET